MKMPPPKPIRLSSISTSDSPPQTPAPPPPAQKPTPSTFNPQNTAKLYDVPKTSILSRFEDRSPKPKQLLLLEDSGSVNSTPVLVQVDGKTPKLAPPAKPVSEERKKHNLNVSQGSPPAAPELKKEIKSETVGPDRPLQTQQLQKVTDPSLSSSRDQPKGPPSQTSKFSPLLDRKLRNLKGGESGASRQASVASPLTLLMAAKERDKHKSSQSSPGNSFAVKPRSSLSFLSSKSIREESSKPAAAVESIQTPMISQKPALVKDRTQSSSINGMAEPSSAAHLAAQLQIPEADHQDSTEELSVPLLPPPPEFGDTDELLEPPPGLPPPDPPRKTPQLTRPSLKPKPSLTSKLPPLQTRVKPETNLAQSPPPLQLPQTLRSPPPLQSPAPQSPPTLQSPPPLPSPLSPSQATLLSILQKKMLEMDHKMAPARDVESGPDDWNSPLSDGDNEVPVIPKATSQSKKSPGVSKAGLDLQELEAKVSTSATRNESSSKHQYGCTFTVRPGSKQPITVVNKGTSKDLIY